MTRSRAERRMYNFVVDKRTGTHRKELSRPRLEPRRIHKGALDG